MTVDTSRLQRRLDGLRRERTNVERTGGHSEADPDIRRAIEAIVAAGEPFGRPQPVWQGIEPVDPATLARRLADGLDADAIETPHGWYVRRELRPV